MVHGPPSSSSIGRELDRHWVPPKARWGECEREDRGILSFAPAYPHPRPQGSRSWVYQTGGLRGETGLGGRHWRTLGVLRGKRSGTDGRGSPLRLGGLGNERRLPLKMLLL